jgi:molybdopterin/thiamine biosynthesis adenylyltransferase
MEFTERAYLADHLGEPKLVIDDEHLLDWALEKGVSPREAQLTALRGGIVPLRYLKNFHSLTLAEQIRICESGVLICGCGGLGGVIINLLARTGVGHLRLVDGDVFVSSNLNRQWICDTGSLGKSKATEGAERARAINPLIDVESFDAVLNDGNAEELIRGMDLVLDGFDNLRGRFVAADAAARSGIPFVHAAVAGWWGQVTTFLPGSGRSLRDIYGHMQTRDRMEESMGVLGATASVIGSLEVLEAVRILAGRDPAYESRLLYFDGESGRMEIVPL